MIEFKQETYGVACLVNGLRFCILTNKTEPAQLDAFKSICNANADTLELIVIEYEQRIQYNHTNPGQAKDWPVFRQRERLLNRLLREAGIRDS